MNASNDQKFLAFCTNPGGRVPSLQKAVLLARNLLSGSSYGTVDMEVARQFYSGKQMKISRMKWEGQGIVVGAFGPSSGILKDGITSIFWKTSVMKGLRSCFLLLKCLQ